jgi:uncharacterized membrane protein
LPLFPVFLSYVLSFVYVGIYWNNHHHVHHACRTVTGAMLCASLHLLFWLSLLPFATGWIGENYFTAMPTAHYGAVLLMAAIAYYVLQQAIIRAQGPDSILKRAVGRDWKGKLSPVLCIVAIGATLVSSWIAVAILAALAPATPDAATRSSMLRSSGSSRTPPIGFVRTSMTGGPSPTGQKLSSG